MSAVDKKTTKSMLVEFLNQAIARHIQTRGFKDRAFNPLFSIEDDVELLELQPITIQEHSSSVRIPELCKFTYCDQCQDVMPPRSEHCEMC